MSWLLFGAVIGLIVLLGHIWRKWVAPWQRIEEMVGRIARGEKPPTFLLDGAAGPRQVGLDLEQLFDRQARLDQQIAERVSGANTVFAALQDGLLLVDSQRRITFVNRAFQELFGARVDDPVSMYLTDVFTVTVNAAGLPGLVIPCALVRGLPVGLQLLGPPGSEENLLRLGYAFEQSGDWKARQLS